MLKFLCRSGRVLASFLLLFCDARAAPSSGEAERIQVLGQSVLALNLTSGQQAALERAFERQQRAELSAQAHKQMVTILDAVRVAPFYFDWDDRKLHLEAIQQRLHETNLCLGMADSEIDAYRRTGNFQKISRRSRVDYLKELSSAGLRILYNRKIYWIDKLLTTTKVDFENPATRAPMAMQADVADIFKNYGERFYDDALDRAASTGIRLSPDTPISSVSMDRAGTRFMENFKITTVEGFLHQMDFVSVGKSAPIGGFALMNSLMRLRARLLEHYGETVYDGAFDRAADGGGTLSPDTPISGVAMGRADLHFMAQFNIKTVEGFIHQMDLLTNEKPSPRLQARRMSSLVRLRARLLEEMRVGVRCSDFFIGSDPSGKP
jgi:hypothetical protein